MTRDVLERVNTLVEDLYYINKKLQSIQKHKEESRVELFVNVEVHGRHRKIVEVHDKHRKIVEVHNRDFAKAVLFLCEVYLLREKDSLEKEMEEL